MDKILVKITNDPSANRQTVLEGINNFLLQLCTHRSYATKLNIVYFLTPTFSIWICGKSAHHAKMDIKHPSVVWAIAPKSDRATVFVLEQIFSKYSPTTNELSEKLDFSGGEREQVSDNLATVRETPGAAHQHRYT